MSPTCAQAAVLPPEVVARLVAVAEAARRLSGDRLRAEMGWTEPCDQGPLGHSDDWLNAIDACADWLDAALADLGGSSGARRAGERP